MAWFMLNKGQKKKQNRTPYIRRETMLSEHKLIEGQVADITAHAEATDREIGNSRFGIGIIMTMAAFVGVWGCICLLNGIAQSQSIQHIGQGLFTALTGI